MGVFGSSGLMFPLEYDAVRWSAAYAIDGDYTSEYGIARTSGGNRTYFPVLQLNLGASAKPVALVEITAPAVASVGLAESSPLSVYISTAGGTNWRYTSLLCASNITFTSLGQTISVPCPGLNTASHTYVFVVRTIAIDDAGGGGLALQEVTPYTAGRCRRRCACCRHAGIAPI